MLSNSFFSFFCLHSRQARFNSMDPHVPVRARWYSKAEEDAFDKEVGCSCGTRNKFKWTRKKVKKGKKGKKVKKGVKKGKGVTEEYEVQLCSTGMFPYPPPSIRHPYNKDTPASSFECAPIDCRRCRRTPELVLSVFTTGLNAIVRRARAMWYLLRG